MGVSVEDGLQHVGVGVKIGAGEGAELGVQWFGVPWSGRRERVVVAASLQGGRKVGDGGVGRYPGIDDGGPGGKWRGSCCWGRSGPEGWCSGGGEVACGVHT